MSFRKFAATIAVFCILMFSCGPAKRGIFSDKRTAHEKYGDRIKEAGLDKTQLGSLWFFAAGKSLAQPLTINLPYKETGYFPADKPGAAGYVFNARLGDRIMLNVSLVPPGSSIFFTELWQHSPTPGEARLLVVADSTLTIHHDVEKDGQYLIRLQPELLQGVEYTLTVTTGPSLAFPVSESGNPRIVSFWHDSREGGKRVHEGVDITGKFRTPAVAIADGFIRSVTDNNLGGKVVFMRPKDKNYTLYYAHLDTQTVSAGDEVKTGQVVGLIGNTGNARSTVPHLHFGIYTWDGAVDPLPFIDKKRLEVKPVTAPVENLNNWIRTTNTSRVYELAAAKSNVVQELKKGEVLKILSATGNWYKSQLPDGREGFINSESTTKAPLNTIIITDTSLRLLDHPSPLAASIMKIENKSKVTVVGTYGDFYLVRFRETEGWMLK